MYLLIGVSLRAHRLWLHRMTSLMVSKITGFNILEELNGFVFLFVVIVRINDICCHVSYQN